MCVLRLQEIYPPKIGDFAYVTDGACSEYDITRQELLVLKVRLALKSAEFNHSQAAASVSLLLHLVWVELIDICLDLKFEGTLLLLTNCK